jgi:hypothetical protein
MRPPLDAFLALLQDEPEVPRHRGVLKEQLGEEILDLLASEEALLEGEPSDWYPCPSARDGCPRVVHRDLHRGAELPHLAMCGSPGSECPSLRLASDDLRTAGLSMERVHAWLQRLMGLPPEPVTVDPAFPHVYRLGKEKPTNRAVLLYQRFGTSSLAAELSALRQRHGAAHIYMPTSTWVPPEVARNHGPGTDPELSFLSEHLAFTRTGLAWTAPGGGVTSTPTAPKAGRAPDAFFAGAYCLAFDGETRPLTEEAYRAELKAAEEKDLFLDLVGRRGKRHRGGVRREGGTFDPQELTQAEGVFAARLMLSGEPQRIASLRPGMKGHYKFLQRVRKKLDVSDGRYGWTFFHQAGESRAEGAYVFKPSNRSFLLLYPKELKP